VDLVRQVESLEDYEQVSQALMELVHLKPATDGQLALNLLRSTTGDAHLLLVCSIEPIGLLLLSSFERIRMRASLQYFWQCLVRLQRV
jgi:hypothetical protein